MLVCMLQILHSGTPEPNRKFRRGDFACAVICIELQGRQRSVIQLQLWLDLGSWYLGLLPASANLDSQTSISTRISSGMHNDTKKCGAADLLRFTVHGTRQPKLTKFIQRRDCWWELVMSRLSTNKSVLPLVSVRSIAINEVKRQCGALGIGAASWTFPADETSRPGRYPDCLSCNPLLLWHDIALEDDAFVDAHRETRQPRLSLNPILRTDHFLRSTEVLFPLNFHI